MKQIIFCTASDLDRLNALLVGLQEETLVIASASTPTGQMLSVEKPNIRFIFADDSSAEATGVPSNYLKELGGFNQVYFVISSVSMTSSTFHAMLYHTIRGMLNSQCWVIKLDDVEIPRGMNILNSFSEDFSQVSWQAVRPEKRGFSRLLSPWRRVPRKSHLR